MKTKGDQQLVKRINRSVLLRLVRAQPGLSRARLAAQSGLTKSTVSLLVRELLGDGWLDEAGASVADGMGRPSTPLHISVGVRALIGVEINIGIVRVVCVSLQGDVLHADAEALDDHAPPVVCAQVARRVAAAHRHLLASGLRLSGIGVGVPGTVDDATGVIRFAPNLGWRNVNLLPGLTDALAGEGVPADIDLQLQNDADAAALGEFEFSDGEGEDPLIFVSCDVGVGAGIVLNDRLFTGARGMAGEIGHTVLQIDGPRCSCGRLGCAEAFISSRVLEQAGGDTSRAARYLGMLLQNLWVTFEPRAIVVGGKSCEAHPEFLRGAIDTVARYAQSAGLAPPVIRAPRYGAWTPAVGAAALALHEYLRPLRSNADARRERSASAESPA
ncbi:Sugar kinase of the NBD/HSP70 family, may contain an N-terminal HTH domain [Variovorax sp. HW608]|uniref:ROK family protein n=1 Tax=Variovorax sp. HW608 TaxID=1034889 RepID=UPI00081F90F1|nr:ROK family protein [Variovorax sp. HW608]SCK34277.1 Sugar kinase of the NBD/HSP70 family, may contain an N-terminal HTH domain [Variovorax sp. HW608]